MQSKLVYIVLAVALAVVVAPLAISTYNALHSVSERLANAVKPAAD
jgi:hypothetical protein